ncbi:MULTISPECIES: hypothetical protein [Ralstonia solanacearum species complex]|uniref:hypothetical protein n=1 Tax=Ralstonia solanacearum species complex TaxID=3116862 RepID=UPI0013A67CDD|nr:hypothetical protein [Ralstonia solanacearum]
MRKRMTIREFLHTRLGLLIWTLVVALLAFNAGQITNPAQGQAQSRARLTT